MPGLRAYGVWLLVLVHVAGALRGETRVLESAGSGLPGPVRVRGARNLRIAIIGAGTSGLTAAYELQKRGYRKITIYEGEPRVGGKVSSIVIDGQVLELGAVLGAKGTPTIYRIARELGILALTPFQPTVKVALKAADGTIAKVSLQRFWGGYPALAVVRGLLRFSQVVWLSQFRHVFRPGFYNLHPDLVNLTMTRFAEKYGFRSILDPVHVVMFACGYGSPDDLAALYWVKFMKSLLKIEIRQGLLFHQSSGYWTFDGGYSALWDKIAAHLVRRGLNLRLGARVTRVARQSEDGQHRIQVTAQDRTDTYDLLLVTSTPQDALKFMDATAEERELLGRARTFPYDAVVFRASGLAEKEWVTLRYNMARERNGHLFSYYNDDPGSRLFTGYQFSGPTGKRQDLDQLLACDIAELGGKLEAVVVRKSWSYFPHVPVGRLTTDYYPRLNALQGERGTFYLGGLLAFESTDHCAEFAEFVVGRY